MADAGQFEKLKSALGRAADCPPLEELAQALDAGENDPRRKAAEDHAAGCGHCRDELALLREFTDTSLRPDETRIVRNIARQLEKQRVGQPARPRFSFFFGMRALAAVASLVLIVAGALYLRQGPGAPSPAGAGDGAMRSQVVEPIDPSGDVRQAPAQFRWRAVPGAVRYQVRLMGVDRQEIWRGEASDNVLSIPASVAALMVPGRSFLWEVSAWDTAGAAVGTPAARSFRVSNESR